MRVVELGCKGHLVVSASCHWSRHTQVSDRYRVSTMGDYMVGGKLETLSAEEGSYFETMVFRTTGDFEPESAGCGCLEVEDWTELELRRYRTAGEAQAGHEEMVARYVAIANGSSDT